jgi:hypothetical protein
VARRLMSTAAGTPIMSENNERQNETAECQADCEIHDGGCCTCGSRGDPCPICAGQGGEISGYYEPEWSDCLCCDGAGRATSQQVQAYRDQEARMDAWVEEQIRAGAINDA